MFFVGRTENDILWTTPRSKCRNRVHAGLWQVINPIAPGVHAVARAVRDASIRQCSTKDYTTGVRELAANSKVKERRKLTGRYRWPLSSRKPGK